MSSVLKHLVLAKQRSIQRINLSCELIGTKRYLRSRVIVVCLAITAHHLITNYHGAESSLGSVGVEAESVHLVVDHALGLIIAGGGRATVHGVLLEITKGVEEGVFLCLGRLIELHLEHLLVPLPPLDL